MDKSNLRKEYTNGEVTVVWESGKCAHTGICVRGLRSVFDVKARPWINMEGADTQAIIDQVNQCPSGALSILEKNSETSASEHPKVQVMKNGPLVIDGSIHLESGDGSEILNNKKTAFCRCGASSNKPYCDGSHHKIKFQG